MEYWIHEMRYKTVGKGQELYIKAKKIIPGGTQLLSKRPEQFLPDQWPAYYSKAKGYHIWDLDGQKYADVSYMGIGANVLGYAFEPVDLAAKLAIDQGGMSTLNAPEEVYLAERLLSLHSWAGMVRYAKSGGESMAQAVRIARTYAKKDIILFCGYHGWHDWYLSANLIDHDSLGDHLLSGLEPNGVPENLRGSAYPFHYNNIEEFHQLIKQHRGKIAAVVMEPIRNNWPADNFLEVIRAVTKKEDIVLIFDEITSGFRLCAGGSHRILNVEPDIAVFAKAIANGYPIAAIVGRTSVMNAAQNSFISSTFWTERVALAAAIASIDFYIENNVQDHLISIGEKVQLAWGQSAKKHDVKLHISGIMPLGHFDFCYPNALAYKTYFIQSMLENGYLASNAFYTSLAHTDELIMQYAQTCDDIFADIKQIQGDQIGIETRLKGPVCHSGFQRLN